MKATKTRLTRRTPGFTVVELLVLLGVIALLGAVFVPGVVKAREQARRIDCSNNLKQVGLAFRLWADTAPEFVMATPTNYGGTLEVANDVWRTFLVMSNELSVPGVLVCPSDSRRPASSWSMLANSNVSYFVCLNADETMPSILLTGDRNISSRKPLENRLLNISSNDVVGWTDAMHGHCGNIGLSDGSAQLCDGAGLGLRVNRSFLALEERYKYLTNRPPRILRLAMPE